jgi:hypothetical protein
MGSGLMSACVYCAAFLFSVGSPPLAGPAADMAVSYSSLGRGYRIDPRHEDLSDVTAKFIGIGLGYARLAEEGRGAGTPEEEFRASFALAAPHDEQGQGEVGPEFAAASGNGRYENFSLLARVPAGRSDSIEAALSRRYLAFTDLLNVGGQLYVLSGQRELTADRIDAGLGWRHRFRDMEAALWLQYTQPHGSDGTQGAFAITRGSLLGFGAELRLRRGSWTISAAGERASGSLAVREKSQPAFELRRLDAPASLSAVRLAISRTVGPRQVELSATAEKAHLPFVSAAILGTETVAFEQGFHPDSRARDLAIDLTVRRRFSERLRVRAFLRTAWGDETVRLTDFRGVEPDRDLQIRRQGIFGNGLSRGLNSPEITLGVGAEFQMSRPGG